jgi:Fe-S cluster biogenesis protein NfuA
VADDKEFQEQIRQLGQLIAQFDQSPESSAKVAGKELVQLLMELHGRGLERAMEIVFESSGKGQETIDKMGQDPIVGSLLLLYSLHPDGLEVRVQNAIERIRPRLRKLSCAIEVESIDDTAVRIRVATASHSCGSSARDIRSLVEDGIYEFAPDVPTLIILGLDEPTPAGFVSLESLMGQHIAESAPTVRPLQPEEVA